MYILGINAYIKHPAACLLKDGKVLTFVEEERFLRIKGAHGKFPHKSVEFCLDHAKINLGEVDKIAVGWDFSKYRFKMPLFFFRSWLANRKAAGESLGIFSIVEELVSQQPAYIKKKIQLDLSSISKENNIPEIEFIPHHLAHAATAFYPSGLDEAAILIIDGSGEEKTTSIFYGTDKEIKHISSELIPNSLGWFYAAITAYLGFLPYRQEGQVMGLAAYGKSNKQIFRKFKKIIDIDRNGKYKVDPRFTLLGDHNHNLHFSDQLVELLGEPRRRNDEITQYHKDIAYAAQELLERAVIGLVKNATDKLKTRKLCMAGGVTLNCKVNGRILAERVVDEIFVQPISHDAGSALGAAMIISKKAGLDPRFEMDKVSWGPSYTAKEIEELLIKTGIRYEKPDSIVKTAAKAIAQGKTVAWFQGRMEAGPRALGNRSILANPTKNKYKDYVNKKVKNRQYWRPFCPSMTYKEGKKYLEQITVSQKEARYMIVTYSVKKQYVAEIPAVLHTDLTTRPQIVTSKSNNRYYLLIKEIGKLTGQEVVLNTSFNVRGEPIVCTPEQAVRTFYSTGLDAMALGDFWLEK